MTCKGCGKPIGKGVLTLTDKRGRKTVTKLEHCSKACANGQSVAPIALPAPDDGPAAA